MTKIGILGSGMVGQALAKGFHQFGHEVMIATRTAEKLIEFADGFDERVTIGSFEDVAAGSELLVLAVKGTIAKEVVTNLKVHLENKIVLDATNPIADTPPEKGVLQYFSSINRSLMEDLQECVPAAKFVKAFSCIGSSLMVHPAFEDKPSMFICGNDSAAKDTASGIATQFGFDVEDMGAAEAARAIEPLAMLWCIPGFKDGSCGHAFKLLKA